MIGNWVASVLPLLSREAGIGDEASDQEQSDQWREEEGKPTDAVLVVKLDELSRVQMRQFAEAQEGVNASAFNGIAGAG